MPLSCLNAGVVCFRSKRPPWITDPNRHTSVVVVVHQELVSQVGFCFAVSSPLSRSSHSQALALAGRPQAVLLGVAEEGRSSFVLISDLQSWRAESRQLNTVAGFHSS